MRNPLESGLSLKDWDVKFQLVWINGLLSLDVGPDICVQGLTTIELDLDHDGQSFVGATKDLESGILGNGIILAVDWKMNIFGRTKDRWHGHLRKEWPMVFHSVSWHFEEEHVRCTGFPSSADFSLFWTILQSLMSQCPYSSWAVSHFELFTGMMMMRHTVIFSLPLTLVRLSKPHHYFKRIRLNG